MKTLNALRCPTKGVQKNRGGKGPCPLPTTAIGRATTLWFFCLALIVQPSHAQQAVRKLPSADKVVNDYLKAIGGKKRIAAIRDATYTWTSQIHGQVTGKWTLLLRAPAARRSETDFGIGEVASAANPRSAWERGPNGEPHTLTGAEGAVAKLQAVLDSGHLVDYKKSNILARVIRVTDSASGPVYVVEFSTRSGAHLDYLFSTKTKLLVGIQDQVRKTVNWFGDYGPEQDILEPHLVQLDQGGVWNLETVVRMGSGEKFKLTLQSVSYNSGIAESVFDPPRGAETLDVVALLREVSRNQEEVEKHVTEYSLLQKDTERELDSKGEVKKETVKVCEVFP